MLVGNIMLTIGVGVVPAVEVWALKSLINAIAEVGNVGISSFIGVLGIFATVNIFSMALEVLKQNFIVMHRLKAQVNIDLDCLEKCETMSLSDFENNERYNFIARTEGEAKTHVFDAFEDVLSIISHLTSIVSIIALLISWKSYLFLLVLVIPIVKTIINTRISYKHYSIRMNRMDRVRQLSYFRFLLTNDIACKEIKAYQTGPYILNLFKRKTNEIRESDVKMVNERQFWTLCMGIMEEGIGLLAILGVVRLTTMGRVLIGNTVAYIDSLSIVQNSISGFLGSMSSLYNDMLYVKQFFDFLTLEIENNQEEGKCIDTIESIVFKNVSFKYPNAKAYSVRNVTLKFQRGERLALVGENGSGKTTFLKLLCGFYTNYEGEIFVNNIEMRQLNKNSLRSKMGIVFQDYNRYEMSIKENIALGNLLAIDDDERINKALKKVGLEEKVKGYNQGINTILGHWFGETDLSKGQWQRLALARAYIREADIYILDEPTASLDPKSEREVYKLMRRESMGRIGVFITHRLENLNILAPRVIVFSEGVLVGDDAHLNLMKNNEHYMQLLGLISASSL